MSTQCVALQSQSAAEFADRMLACVSNTLDMFGIYLGDQLGFYEVLTEDGPLTPAELAARTGTQVRYVREWMEHQAVAGILEVADSRFYLPPDRAEVLADRDSLNYMAAAIQLAAGAVAPVQKVVRAFREGGGVPYEEYGADLREGQGRMNRPVLLKLLGREWIPAMPDIHERLAQSDGTRVADFGCGVGWSSIGVALSYPNVRVDGFDSDGASIQRACEHAMEHGVFDRVKFMIADAGNPDLEGRYDLVIAMECVHDMSNPVDALTTMRRLVHPEGAVLVIDERVADAFDPNAGLIEKFMYGFSVLHCLPAGMSDEPSAATGTVMRHSTFERYALEAGFHMVEVLPVEHPLFRLYRLYA